MSRAERVESELVSLADWIERYFASRDLLPPPAIAAGVASARAALALPADAAGSAEAVRAACAAVPALEEARRRRLRWADEAHAQILAVPAPAHPAPDEPQEPVAWDGIQALIDSADKCADMMDAQECPVSGGGEEWDAALCELRERADAVRAARIDAWRPTPRAEAASAEAVRDLPPLKADEAVFQAANAVVARLIMSAGHRLTRYESELLRRLDSAIRSLPLPAAPASAEATVWANLLEALVGLRAKDDAEAVAREAAREAVRLADSDRGDGATSMSEEAIINRAVAHALRAKGDR